MYPLSRLAVPLIGILLIAATAAPALAGSPTIKKDPDPGADGIQIRVSTPGHHGGKATRPGRKPPAKGGTTAQPVLAPDGTRICSTTRLATQPPTSDPIWAGHTTGAIYVNSCVTQGIDTLSPNNNGTTTFWQDDPDPTGPTAASPAVAARQALATLQLPHPGAHRSPPETNQDAGTAYTWVNIPTWYWTTPATWQHHSATAHLPGVSATVTAKPLALTFDPGNGNPADVCTGPGRPWTDADANTAPTNGGCAYTYQHVSDRTIATTTIRWAITWAGTGGAQGTFPDMSTTTTSPAFKVEQIETVNIYR